VKLPVIRGWYVACLVALKSGGFRTVTGCGGTVRFATLFCGRGSHAERFTWLAMEHGSLGWITIAAIVIVATLTMGPSSRAAERYLARHGSAA